MKIGILTYHRADNYGAVLQAFALYKYIKDLGYDVEHIDYWPHYHADVYKSICWNKWIFYNGGKKQKIIYIFKYIKQQYKSLKRKRRFEEFRRNHMNIASRREYYDSVFYGSDIIWHQWRMNDLYTGFDSTYWGDDSIKANHKFAYAASMGNVLNTKITRKQCSTYLPYFEKISVREDSLKRKLEEWGFQDIIQVVDPTLLITFEQWNSIVRKRIVKEDYILCYNLENSKVINGLAQKVAYERHLRCIYLTGTVGLGSNQELFDMAGPVEFLSLFKYASYIVTSSFHGCVFSILFKKQFCFHSEIDTERITSLLQQCKLEDRFINTIDANKIYKIINYSQVYRELASGIQKSRNYILSCLKSLKS